MNENTIESPNAPAYKKLSAKLWAEEKIDTLKNRYPDTDNHTALQHVLTEIKNADQLDVLLSKGASLKNTNGNYLIVSSCHEINANSLNKDNFKGILKRVVEVKKENSFYDFKKDSPHYHLMYRNLSRSTFLAKLFSALDIDWSLVSYELKSSSSPYLHSLALSGPASAKILLNAKKTFSSVTNKEKQDYLSSMASVIFNNLIDTIYENKSSPKKQMLDLLNSIMKMMDKDNVERFTQNSKNWAKQRNRSVSFEFDHESQKWSFDKISNPPPAKTLPKSSYNFKKIIGKRNKTLKEVRYLKANGFDFSGHRGLECLMDAIIHPNLKVCKFLVDECGVDMSLYKQKAEQNQNMPATLLHLAARYHRSDIVEFLISKKEDVNAVNKKNETPLFIAVNSSNIKTIDILLKSGADINHKNINDYNALFSIPTYKNPENLFPLVNHLIKKGIDPFHRSSITNENFIDAISKKTFNNKSIITTLNQYLVHLSANEVKSNIQKSLPATKNAQKRKKLI